MKNEMGGISEEVFLPCFNELFQNLPGGTSQCTCQICLTHWPNLLVMEKDFFCHSKFFCIMDWRYSNEMYWHRNGYFILL